MTDSPNLPGVPPVPDSASLEPRRLGRPSLYTPDLGAFIVDQVAQGRSFVAISKDPGMPDWSTMYGWAETLPDFSQALARAKRSKADLLASDGLRIVDACDGNSNSQVGKAREQGAYRRWLAGCLDRDTYGDRPPQVNVQVNTVTTGFLDVARVASSTQGDVAPIPHVQAPDVGDDEASEG